AHKTQIASVPGWTGFREYTLRTGDNAPLSGTVSTPITLVAGNRYYLEALYKEGGGGDHCEVAVRRPGDPPIANGQAGIPLDQFAPQMFYAGAPAFLPALFTPGPVAIDPAECRP